MSNIYRTPGELPEKSSEDLILSHKELIAFKIENEYPDFSEEELKQTILKINKKLLSENLIYNNDIYFQIYFSNKKLKLAKKIVELYRKKGYNIDINTNSISNSFFYYLFVSKTQIKITIKLYS